MVRFLFRLMRLPVLIALFGQAAWAAELPQNTASAGPAGAVANAAADTDTAAQIAARAAIKAGATPVEVELEGTDALGAKLAFQLKEQLNSGTLFLLTGQDTPKIRILLATATEFSSRPEVGSVYSALWLYYEKPTSFNSYLAREVGVITPGGTEDLAARLAERTAGIAAKYSYIFEKR
jgi:hypothetical protein